MIVQDAYYVNKNEGHFRSGQPARIVGVKIVKPDGLKPRLCYKLRWDDGVEDYIPVSEPNDIITLRELCQRSQ